MAFNNSRRIAEQLEAASVGVNLQTTAQCLREVFGLTEAQAGGQGQAHQFNFDQTLRQQLQTSGFSNTSFFTTAWQQYEAQYRRDHQNNAPNLETIRNQFLNPFVTAIGELLFPANQRNTPQYTEFQGLLARWALCQTMFNNLVLAQFDQQQRQLLINHDWLHLSPTQRQQLLTNVPALAQLAQNEQVRQRMLQLPSFSAQDAARLQALIPRPNDAPAGGQPQMSPEEQNLRRGIAAYIALYPSQREHLEALLARAPGQRSAGDNIELTVCSLLPYCQNRPGRFGTVILMYEMYTYALYNYLRTQPNGLTGALSPQLRAQLQIHSDNAGTRDFLPGLVDVARGLPASGNMNRYMQEFTTALQRRNMPGLQR